MSVSGLNQQYLPNTLDGLNIVEADQVYIDGQLVNLSDYVPFENASRTLNMGAQNIQTTHDAITGNDVVNKSHLDNVVSNLSIAIAGSFLDKVTTTPQTVIGNVSYTAQLSTDNLLVPTTKTASLGSVLTVDANYRRSENDSTVSVIQYFGSISSSLGIYQATSTQNYAILQVADLGVSGTGKRMDINWNLNINEGSYNSSIQLFASDNGINTNQYLGPSVSFTPSDPLYNVMSGTFVPQYRYICVLCITSKPSGVQTVRWYDLQLDEQGVDITALTMSAQNVSQIPILNDKKQLVGSGVSSTKVIYLDNCNEDIQSALNNRLKLDGSNANQNIIIGAYKVQSSATPSIGNDYTNKTYVDTAISGAGALYVLKAGDTMTGTLNMGANKITSSYTALTSNDLTNKNYVDYYLGLKGNLSGGNTWSGDQIFNSGTVSVYNRLLGLPDSTPSGNFWMGLRGSGTEVDRLAISIVGNITTGVVDRVLISKVLRLSQPTANRVLTLDVNGDVVSSTVTPTTLSYLDIGSSLTGLLATKGNLSGGNTWNGNQTFNNLITFAGYTAGRVLALGGSSNLVATSTTLAQLSYLDATSSIQTQLDSKASTTYVDSQLANYLPLTGGTLTGLLKINPTAIENRKLVLWDGGANNDYQYYGLGVNGSTFRFNIYGTAEKYSFFAGTSSTAANEVFRINGSGALESGVSGASANTTPNLLLSSSAQHVDNSAGQVYLFSATNGHLGIQRNTVRNATTACLALGTADTEQSEIISYKADGSTGYMPLAYAGSVHAWVVGNSTDIALTSYSFLGQTGFDGSNNVNFQCQASQYGRNRLYMTGRYEASNDAWSFATGRNSIIFRTQSSLNSAYTNRWAIQNFADALGFLSASGGNTPRLVMKDNGTIGIGTTDPTTLLEIIGSYTLFSVRDIAAISYSAIRLGNNSGYGCYLFLNGSSRTDDGGVSTATLRNDLGSLRVQAQYGLGITMDNDGCMKAYSGTITSTNPGSANMAGYFGITRADLRNSAGLWTGIDSGNNVWQLSLRPDVSWNGWNGRASYYTWYVSNGPSGGSLLINNNGAVNVAGNSPFAVPNGYMSRGSLTIGSTDANYGWGSSWTSSTAGLLLECADLTEIAVHDAGHRVASMIAYAGGAGRNWLVLGRDMGWGSSYVTTTSTFSVATDSQYGRFNVYNPDGSYTHFGTSERINYVRGGKTLFDTTTDTYWHLNWYYDAYSPGAHLYNSPGTWSVSIWATGAVVTNYWFGTVSDRRIKKNIQPVGSMLNIIKRIEVVSFDFIDSNNKRDECGIIAQQVEEIFPNIVDKSVGIIPNILKRATSFEKGEGTLTVFYPRQVTDELEVGSRVKLMFGIVGATEADSKKKGEYTEKVLRIASDSIVVEWTSPDDISNLSLIVYGKEVDDFRNVDKEQFAVMAIKGIQEQQTQIEEQQKRIATLEARETIWVDHAKEQEAKMMKMQKDLEKMAGLLSQLISKQ